MRRITVAAFLLLLCACTQEPKPEWEVRYEKARAEADAAFIQNQLARAGELFRTASDALPAGDPRREDCAKRIGTCRFLELREMGLKLYGEGKTAEATVVFENAIKSLPEGDPRIAEAQEKLKGLRFQAKSGAGREKLLRQNWLEAAKDFEGSLELATADQQKEMNTLIAFCRKGAEADEAFLGKKDYAKAAPLYEELLKDPHGLQKEISEKLASVRAEAAKAGTLAKGEKEGQFKRATFEASTYFAQAQWARAKEALDAATATGISSPDFEALSKRINAAVSPPPGFVYVPAGKFLFGSGPAESATGPQQEVETEAFYFSKREVSNAEYRKFLEAYKDHSRCHPDEPAEKKAEGHVPQDWADAADPEKPVVGVDWFDAWSYSRWAGGRLASEAEWEKAAGWDPRSGKKLLYPWGDDFVTGKGGPSPCGAEGMAGGALEWVEDWYEPYHGGKCADLDFGKKRRVARGGIFLREDEVEDSKVTHRSRFLPSRRDRSIGFRIVKPIK